MIGDVTRGNGSDGQRNYHVQRQDRGAARESATGGPVPASLELRRERSQS